MDRGELLRQVPLFSGLERKELEQIAASMKERTFREGQEITTEGEHGVGFFVIDDGEAAVTVRGEQRTILRRGDYFGEIALIANRPRTATVIAKSPMKLEVIGRREFQTMLHDNPGIATELLGVTADRLHDIEDSEH
jgi:CRP-like cAMP-binding protein